jgi:hypothetical protein
MSKGKELLRIGMDYKELGISLVEKAQEQEREQTERVVVNGVQSILKDIATQESIIEQAKERVEKQKSRVEALRKGQFTVKFNTGMHAPAIEFKDASLNASL